MQAILLLLSFISRFVTSETGSVRQRTSMPLAWGAGVLMAAALLFGVPGRADAQVCEQLSGCENNSTCAARCQAIGCATGQCIWESVPQCRCYY